MTEVTVYEASDGYAIGIEANNHSGFDAEGNDIVCAAITTVFEVVSAGLKDLPRSTVEDDRTTDNTHWSIRINDSQLSDDQKDSVERLMTGSIETLRNVSQHYSEHCSLETERVKTL